MRTKTKRYGSCGVQLGKSNATNPTFFALDRVRKDFMPQVHSPERAYEAVTFQIQGNALYSPHL